MSKNKAIRDKAAEKAVKERLSRTHLKYVKIISSEKKEGNSAVYVLRIIGSDNYLFKVNCSAAEGKKFDMTGLIPVNNPEELGEFRMYNLKTASAEVLRPIEKEKKFTGYSR